MPYAPFAPPVSATKTHCESTDSVPCRAATLADDCATDNLCYYSGGATKDGACCLNTSGFFGMQCCDLTQPAEDTYTQAWTVPAGKYWVVHIRGGEDDGNLQCYETTLGLVEPFFEKLCTTCPDDTVYYQSLGVDKCAYCNEGDQFCVADGLCHEGDEPPCKEELNCEWDADTCEWVCDDPTTLCAVGETFDLCLCQCVPECPEGYYWSGTAAACVLLPECLEQLHCVRLPPDCDYVCDDPAVKCSGRAWLGPPDCRCEAGGGCDLAELNCGWLVRAYMAGTSVMVGTSRDAGVTWEDVTVAADGVAGESAPALAVDRHDTLWLTYHNNDAGATSYLYRSDDLGTTWEQTYSIGGRTYPRPCSTPERLLLATQIHLLNAITITAALNAEGTSFGASIHEVPIDAAEFRPDLRMDRRGLLHLVYEATDGSVLHRWSADGGDTWTEPETVAADGVGAEAGYQMGAERALLTWWDEGTLKVATTDETFAAYEETVSSPTTTEYQPQQLGVLWDRRETAWLLGLVDDEPVVVWSRNVYAGWAEPT